MTRDRPSPHWNFGALVTASPGGFYRCLLGGHLQTGPEKTWNGAIQNAEVDPILDEKSARFKRNPPIVASIPRKLLVWGKHSVRF